MKRSIFKRFLLYPLSVLLFLFFAGEIILRLIGYEPWPDEIKQVSVKPAGTFFKGDSLLGYAGKPGEFEINQNDNLKFRINHNYQGYRTTSEKVWLNDYNQVWIFGCSFTHGWGLQNEQTFPWIIQQARPDLSIRNFGMSGYSTLQNLLQCKALLETNKPEKIILCYGGFHNQRNVADNFWLRSITPVNVMNKLSYPYARLNQDSLIISYLTITKTGVPGSGHFAMINYLQNISYSRQSRSLRPYAVTHRIIKKFNQLCISNNIGFTIAGITSDTETKLLLDELKKEGINCIDISVDLHDSTYTLLPIDPHPNAKANLHYAKKILDLNVLPPDKNPLF